MIKQYQIDAFATRLFEGNPAAVIETEHPLTDQLMQNIATENNLSETAFIVNQGKAYSLRWFTPKGEVDLCGHATLAAAHYLYQHTSFAKAEVLFSTRSGLLKVQKIGEQYAMDFPLDKLSRVDNNYDLAKIIDKPIVEIVQGKTDYLFILELPSDLLSVQVDFAQLKKLPVRGLIISTRGQSTDIISRCFYPAYGIEEDPVTGSAHTTLGAYWSPIFQRSELSAFQASPRGGHLQLQVAQDRIQIRGQAITFCESNLWLVK